MDAQHDVPAPATTLATAAAFLFRATDEHGELFPADEQFASGLANGGVDWALAHVCALDVHRPREARIAADIGAAYGYLNSRKSDWLASWLGGAPDTSRHT